LWSSIAAKGTLANVSNPNSMVYRALLGILFVPTRGADANAA